MEEHAPKTCLFATNTSSLRVDAIAEGLSDTAKANMGGVHFFNVMQSQ